MDITDLLDAQGIAEAHAARDKIDLLRLLVSDVLSIADGGATPDGDEVNIPTLLWAEEWKRKLTPNVQLEGPAASCRSPRSGG